MRLARILVASCLAACTSSQPGSDAAAAPSPPTATYFALGDSFTIGTGATPAESFPARMVHDWGCAVRLVNAGVDGFTTEDVIDVELPEMIAASPKLATLLVGANDIVQGESEDVYRSHLRAIFQALARAGVARVVALPQPDWSKSPTARLFGDPASLYAKIVAFNRDLAEEAAAARREYVDLFPLMETEAEAGALAADGLHPSADAYAAWGKALAAKVHAPCAAP